MLERLWLKEEFSNHYLSIFLLSFLFGIFSILITYHLIPFKIEGSNLGGLIAVLLITAASSYPLLTYLQQREKEEVKKHIISETTLFDRHCTELVMYLSFFFGVALAFVVGGLMLPGGFFFVQDVIISDITGAFFSPNFFMVIFSNNLSVFLLTFFLSFVLNAGMIFILVWNASIFGIFVSELSENLFRIPVYALGYLPHGILEIGGYVFAGFAGFVLSYQIEYYLESEESDNLYPHMRDALVILAVGFILLLLGAIVESTGAV